MITTRTRDRRPWSSTLRWAPWATLGVGGVLALSRENARNAAPEDVFIPAMAVLFVVLVTQVVVALRRWPSRRAGLSALLVGLVLWCAGSVVLNSGSSSGPQSFPSPGELLFLAASLAFAAFLVLDVDRRAVVNLGVWVDAVILCCGAGVIVAGALLVPTVSTVDSADALFVALMFPVIDTLLALVVIGQIALRARAVSRRNVYLVVGFILLAVADASLAASAGVGAYGFTIALDLMWGAALTLVVAGGCRDRDQTRPDRREPPAAVVTAFAGLALVVLVVLALKPPGPIGVVLAIPATLTLVAVGFRLVLALRDARHAAESYRLAQTDDLTGLPNRRALLRTLDRHLANGDAVSLLLFDLDGFKEVNDSLGHSAGDEVLQAVAARLQEATPATRYLARLGGDEFALITPSTTPERCLADAGDIRAALSRPVRVSDLTWSIHASVGVGTATEHGTTASDLLRQADVAMYEAKRTRSGAAVYDAERDVFSRHRLQLADELRLGVDAGELELWYQPQLDATSLDLVGVEALVRWRHPTEGMIQPAVFLPVARRAGLMPALSLAVAQLVVAQAADWDARGRTTRIAMNIAPPELLRGPLLDLLYDLLDASGLPAHRVALEVTEDSFLNDPDRARELLVEAHRRGVSTSIDDFGTGFSSLAYLRDLPVTELKVDRGFVQDVVSDSRSRLIVESVIRMAHALGMLTVAEGVEDGDTHELLRQLGVDRVQGYLYARPMPSTAFDVWLTTHERRARTPVPADRPPVRR